MSEHTHSPHPRTPRKGARSAQSTSGSEQHIAGQSNNNRGGRRVGRGGKHPQQRQKPDIEVEGSFDENGNYITNNALQQDHLSAEKRPSRKHNPAAHDAQEITMQVPSQQQPFPSLKGTPHKPYAGPTFHASPAASALPMPRFFSKSVPSPASSAPSLLERANKESTDDQARRLAATPEHSPSVKKADPAPMQPRTESPLDVFFSAARAEKAKQQSSAVVNVLSTTSPSRTQQPTIATHASHPASQSPAPKSSRGVDKAPNHWAAIYGGSRPSHNRNFSGDSSKGLFLMELDGQTQSQVSSSPQRQPLPATATPPASLHRTASDGSTSIPHHQHSPFYTNHGLSTPNLPSEMEATSIRRPGSVPFHHQNQPNSAPRIAGSSPFQTPPRQNHHSQMLHYGNKNLSPVFQASKNHSGRTQSQLRTELSESSHTRPHEQPGSPPTSRNAGNPSERQTSCQTTIAAQRYLSDMISRSSSNSSLPTQGNSSAPTEANSNGMPSHSLHDKENSASTDQRPVQRSTSKKSMEADLRRLLKISENW